MKYYADLHIHSYYSRATSKLCNLEHLNAWAQIKGIGVVGTGDFTHPQWLEELEEKLEPAEEGLFALKEEYARTTQELVPRACVMPVRFMLSAEISNIYKRLDRVRKVHNAIYAPGFEAARKIQTRLDAIGNVKSDGRPILGLDSRDLLEIVIESDPLSFLIPAHIWTPWFSALGSKGGFDKIENCYGDLIGHIFAVETGLSSDPLMNWRLTQLDPFVLVSNSDAHSPNKLGREANIFDCERSYPAMYNALKDPADKGFVGTVEFFPEEGKYHLDGHRKCSMRLQPRETAKHGGRCPKCSKPVVVGVMSRVEELADRTEGEKSARWRPFYSLVPLNEIIGEAVGVGPTSKKVQGRYNALTSKVGNEFYVLRDAPIEDIRTVAGPVVAEGIRRVREGDVDIAAGYDGEYGEIRLFRDNERSDIEGQYTLFASLPTQRSTKTTEPIDFPQGAEEQLDLLSAAAFSRETVPPPSVEEPVAETVDENGRPSDLNEAQWKAVNHEGSHLLIVAGPGTGKTHTITHRIRNVAESLDEGQKVLAITFTNRAAEDMRERIARRAGPELAAQVEAGTFHQFCLGLLRRYHKEAGVPQDFAVAGSIDIEAAARSLWPGNKAKERSEVLEKISRWKCVKLAQARYHEGEAYRDCLRERNLLDFDDLLLDAWTLLKDNETVRNEVQSLYRAVFVDEYQDINEIQHALLVQLVGEGVTITAIGDPNQAIYGFRGSDVKFFPRFTRSFAGAEVCQLTNNYRTAVDLLSASAQVIEHGDQFNVPALVAKIHAEGKLFVHEAPTAKAEAEYVVHQIERLLGGTSMFSQDSGRVGVEGHTNTSFGDLAVLYRLNALRPALEEALERSGIPYQVSGERPLSDEPIVADSIAVLRLAGGQSVSADAARRVLERAVPGLSGNLGHTLAEWWRVQMVRAVDVKEMARALELCPEVHARVVTSGAEFAGRISALGELMNEAGVAVALEPLGGFEYWHRELSGNARSAASWKRLIRIARAHNDLAVFLDYFALLRADDTGRELSERVSLLTLHAAKGLEFAAVFIVGCEDTLLPLNIAGMESQLEEERRLLYVGMSRAKERLHLVRAKSRTLFGKTYEAVPSPFLADIDEALKSREDVELKRRVKPKDEAEQLSLL